MLAGSSISEEFSSFYQTLSNYFRQIQDNATNLTDKYNFLGPYLEDIESNILNTSQTVFNILRQNPQD